MDDIAAQLQQLLSDPVQMAQLTQLAESLGFGQGQPNEEPQTEEPTPMGKLLPLLSQASGRESQIFGALRPYLSPEDQHRADRALRAAKLSRLATLALTELQNGDAGGLP